MLKKQEDIVEYLIPDHHQNDSQPVIENFNSISDSQGKDEIANELNYVKSNDKFEVNIINSEIILDDKPNKSQFSILILYLVAHETLHRVKKSEDDTLNIKLNELKNYNSKSKLISSSNIMAKTYTPQHKFTPKSNNLNTEFSKAITDTQE